MEFSFLFIWNDFWDFGVQAFGGVCGICRINGDEFNGEDGVWRFPDEEFFLQVRRRWKKMMMMMMMREEEGLVVIFYCRLSAFWSVKTAVWIWLLFCFVGHSRSGEGSGPLTTLLMMKKNVSDDRTMFRVSCLIRSYFIIH